ncbi:EutP/PduV family microcompartment system protein [Streptococcus ovis]
MKKRMMLIGPNDQDKKKLVALLEEGKQIPPVQSMVYLDKTIQVPSSYLRGSGMLKHIIATQQNASAILMLLSPEQSFRIYSPNFAKVFRIPIVGIILTKQGCHTFEDIKRCRSELEEAKIERIQVLDLENDAHCQQLLHTISLIEEGMI